MNTNSITPTSARTVVTSINDHHDENYLWLAEEPDVCDMEESVLSHLGVNAEDIKTINTALTAIQDEEEVFVTYDSESDLGLQLVVERDVVVRLEGYDKPGIWFADTLVHHNEMREIILSLKWGSYHDLQTVCIVGLNRKPEAYLVDDYWIMTSLGSVTTPIDEYTAWIMHPGVININNFSVVKSKAMLLEPIGDTYYPSYYPKPRARYYNINPGRVLLSVPQVKYVYSVWKDDDASILREFIDFVLEKSKHSPLPLEAFQEGLGVYFELKVK